MKCDKCNGTIHETEDYVKFIEYSKGNEIGNRFYHKTCFIEKMGRIKNTQLRDIIKRTKQIIMEE